jgi:glycosyltransferase involved in cell wall biosynthesis
LVFRFRESLPSESFFSKVKAARYPILFLPEGKRYGLTKLYELAACGRPIIAIGKPSELSRMIEDNKLGRFVRQDSLEEDLEKALKELSNFNSNREWVKRYSLSLVTENLLDIFNN